MPKQTSSSLLSQTILKPWRGCFFKEHAKSEQWAQQALTLSASDGSLSATNIVAINAQGRFGDRRRRKACKVVILPYY